jgi:hypothetical protein
MARIVNPDGSINYKELIRNTSSTDEAVKLKNEINKMKSRGTTTTDALNDAADRYLNNSAPRTTNSGDRSTTTRNTRDTRNTSPSNRSTGGSSSGGSATKTTIVTPGGVYTSGWIIDGRTYYDKDGKNSVDPGTFVKAGGKWYEKQADGTGKEVNTSQNNQQGGDQDWSGETVPEDGWDGPIRSGDKGYQEGNKRDLMTAAELAEIYGITWDANEIYDLYKEGVEETYNNLAYESRMARNNLTDTLANQYDLYNSTLRDQRAGAIQSGVSKGVAAAQEVLSLLGAQGQSADILSEYTQLMNQQAQTKAKAMTDAKERAFSDSNFITQYLGNLGLGIYNADVQRDVAELAAQAQMQAAQIQADGNLAASQAAASRYQQPMTEFGFLAENMSTDELLNYLTGRNSSGQTDVNIDMSWLQDMFKQTGDTTLPSWSPRSSGGGYDYPNNPNKDYNLPWWTPAWG